MSDEMKGAALAETRDVLSKVAEMFGSDHGNAGLPIVASAVIVGVMLKALGAQLPGAWYAVLFVCAWFVMTLVVMHFYVPFKGKLILRAIEKDYGPLTRQHVVLAITGGEVGDLICLDIPAVARHLGESCT